MKAIFPSMKLPTVVISLILLTMTARADPFAERQEIAIKIVEVLNRDKLDDETLRKMCMTRMEEEAKKRHLTTEEWKLLKLASAETIAAITREQLVEVMAKGYAARLSLDELKAVLAFYESPAGKALQREQAGINKEAYAQMKILTDELVMKVEARYETLKKEKAKESP
jgi:hypothetical protein